MRTHHILATLALTALLSACGGNSNGTTYAESGEEEEAGKKGPEGYSDRLIFELSGPVKECIRDMYYDVKVDGDKVTPDTAGTNHREFQVYFDELGNYVPSKDEHIKRDNKGRMTYWRDARPNGQINPGVLRDTINYKYVNNNVLVTDGMAEHVVSVYDNNANIVGQYSQPRVEGTENAAFNIIRATDDHGNWTERLTVWVTKSKGGKPDVHYTLDRREIRYY